LTILRSANLSSSWGQILGLKIAQIKRFTAVIYEWAELARVFVPGKPFQPSLMFASKTEASGASLL
jgi:hypothetical protein